MCQKSRMIIFLLLFIGIGSSVAVAQKKPRASSPLDAKLRQVQKENDDLVKQLKIKQLEDQNAELRRQLAMPAVTPAQVPTVVVAPVTGPVLPPIATPIVSAAVTPDGAPDVTSAVIPVATLVAAPDVVPVAASAAAPVVIPATAAPGGPSLPAAQDRCLTQSLDPQAVTRIDFAICLLAKRMEEDSGGQIDPNLTGSQLAQFASSKLAKGVRDDALLKASERVRTDKQIGSSPGSSGTTSLVVKGGAPTLIGWAVEQGAATSAVSGNTVTVKFNPYNLSKALFYNQNIIDLKTTDSITNPLNSFFKHLTVGVSFDMTRGNATPLFTGSKQQISGYSIRYEFLNRRNPFSAAHSEKLLAFWDSQDGNRDLITGAIGAIIDGPHNKIKNPVLEKWVNDTNAVLLAEKTRLGRSLTRPEIESIIRSQLDVFPTTELAKHADFVGAATAFAAGNEGFKKARDKFIESLNQGAVASFEYSSTREVNTPDTSNFRVILEKGVFKIADFTFNGSLTMFNKKPASPTVKRIKDFDFSAQLDLPLRNILPGNNSLSFAGRYARQPGDILLPNGVVANGSRGDIALGQIKLTIPLWDSGIRLPFSVTFANRTDFIKESRVKGNFGFTLDLDQIIKPFRDFSSFLR